MKVFFLTLLFFSSVAEARVFRFGDGSFAGYFRSTYASPSAVGNSPYNDSSGSTTVTDGEIETDFGGEIGLLIGLSPKMFLRAGFEAVRGRNSEIEGTSAAAVKYFDLSSSVLALGPAATLEFVLSEGEKSRWTLYGGASWMQVSVDNEYEVTAAGDTAYGGAGGGAYTYNEKLDADVIALNLGAAYERFLVDNVAWLFELGYRSMNFSELKYRSNATNAIRGATQVSLVDGQTATNDDGSNRSINMSGVYIGLTLRFYVQL